MNLPRAPNAPGQRGSKKRRERYCPASFCVSYITSSPYFPYIFFLFRSRLFRSFFFCWSVPCLWREKEKETKQSEKEHLYSQYHSRLFFFFFPPLFLYTLVACALSFSSLESFVSFLLSIGRPSRWTVGIWPWPKKAFKKSITPNHRKRVSLPLCVCVCV